jgi:hypothetical protein
MIKGGYKTYRAQVREFMAGLGTWPVHVISGKTGSGKGLMLDVLRRQGAQVRFWQLNGFSNKLERHLFEKQLRCRIFRAFTQVQCWLLDLCSFVK